ncbi:MAG: hypothetical protein WBA74_04340, partial [Cyclobacteriaceae bacterium]
SKEAYIKYFEDNKICPDCDESSDISGVSRDPKTQFKKGETFNVSSSGKLNAIGKDDRFLQHMAFSIRHTKSSGKSQFEYADYFNYTESEIYRSKVSKGNLIIDGESYEVSLELPWQDAPGQDFGYGTSKTVNPEKGVVNRRINYKYVKQYHIQYHVISNPNVKGLVKSNPSMTWYTSPENSGVLRDYFGF